MRYLTKLIAYVASFMFLIGEIEFKAKGRGLATGGAHG